MQPLCTSEEQCLYFFPHMGFRPAVHVVQRDQYGDRMTLVVGDDSPLEGKVPVGYDAYRLPVGPWAMLPNPAGPLAATLASGTPGSAGGGSWPVPVWGGGGGSPGKSRPGIDDTSSVPPDGGPGPSPHNPGKPTTPVIDHPTFPPVPEQPTFPPITEQPTSPELPPIAPVPLPDAAPMLIGALLALTLLRRVKG